ncbi:MAG: HAMP domain-containing histidine kinase, partial [Gammaproteobacteria bacterium]|nr:HAMP domain-containing histidine kinase [Gammaproteobacteria bacterium]
ASGFITRNLLHPLRRFEKYFAALNEGGSEAVLADEPYHEWNIVAQSIKEAIARMYEAQSKRSEFERNLALATQMAHLGVVQLNTNTGRLVIDRVILERMGLPNFKKISDMLASLARSDHLKLQEMLERLKRHQKVDLNLAFVNQKNEIVLAKIVAESVPGVGQFDVIGLLQDVTEAAHLERMKEDFVATVSHELRTPLTAIKGASALILQGALGTISPQVRASLELSSRNVLRLENLVNDILDMEKLSSGRFQFNLKELDVDEFMQEVKQANTAFTETANIDIELQNKLEMRESIRADKMRLHQVMTNFISNAVKYSPPNTSIILRAHRDNNDAVISLVDFGPGIQEDFKRYVFTKFSQAQASSTRNIQKGTGLGLAIAKEMVEHMGGTIGFSSVLGQGTEFWVRFALSSRHV